MKREMSVPAERILLGEIPMWVLGVAIPLKRLSQSESPRGGVSQFRDECDGPSDPNNDADDDDNIEYEYCSSDAAAPADDNIRRMFLRPVEGLEGTGG